jgi:hypothetical protein
VKVEEPEPVIAQPVEEEPEPIPANDFAFSYTGEESSEPEFDEASIIETEDATSEDAVTAEAYTMELNKQLGREDESVASDRIFAC